MDEAAVQKEKLLLPWQMIQRTPHGVKVIRESNLDKQSTESIGCTDTVNKHRNE